MNVIVPPPEADPDDLAAALRTGRADRAEREAVAAVVETLAHADRLIRAGGAGLSAADRGHVLDVVLASFHSALRAAARGDR